MGLFKKKQPSTHQTVQVLSTNNVNISNWNEVASIFKTTDANGVKWDIIEKMAYDDTISAGNNFINNNVLALSRGLSGNAEQIKFIETCFENININQYIKNLLQSRIKGFSLFEPVWKIENLKYELDKMILLDSANVNFETDKFARLEKISVGGEYYPLSTFWLFTHEATTENPFYGTSIFETIFREWYIKDNLVKFELMGIENFAMPPVVFNYLATKYKKGTEEYAGLQAFANFKSGSRLVNPVSQKGDGSGELLKDIEIEKIEFETKGLQFIRTAIIDCNKAIKDNMGILAEYDNISNGSNAKMVTIDKVEGRIISSVALPLQYNIQQLVDLIAGYNFETPDVIFSFDFNTDKGMTKEKAEVLKLLLEGGTELTQQAKANYLDIDISEIVEKQAEPIIPESFGNKNNIEYFEVIKRLPKPNIKRIERRLDSIENESVDKLGDNIQKQTTKINKKIQKYIDDVKLVDKAFGDLNEKNKRVFQETLFASYFAGKDEALSELEKQGFDSSEKFERYTEIEVLDKVKQTVKEMYIKAGITENNIELFENYNEVEIFEAIGGVRYVQGTWLREWLAKTGLKINKMDKVWLKHVLDYAWTLSQDVNSIITKIYRDVITTQMGKATNTEIISMINGRLGNAGLISDLNPYHLKTAVNTASSTYFNNARQAQFLDDDLVSSGFMKAFEFTAVMDSKTSDVCAEHDQMIIDIDDPNLANFTPPCHPNCRSILTPITKYYYDKSKVNFRVGTHTPAQGFGGGRK